MQLEMVFIMKISLHLETLHDVYAFMTINKKCCNAVSGLQVNPFLLFASDIEKYYQHFKQQTLNCNFLPIHFEVIKNAKIVRNINISLRSQFPPNTEDEKDKFFSKFHNFDIPKGRVEFIPKIIEKATHSFTLKCSPKFFFEFVTKYEQSGGCIALFPQKVVIEMSRDTDFGQNIYRKYKGWASREEKRFTSEQIVETINASVDKYNCDVYCDWTNNKYFECFADKLGKCKHYTKSHIYSGDVNQVHPIDCNNKVVFTAESLYDTDFNLKEVCSVIDACYLQSVCFGVSKKFVLNLKDCVLSNCVQSFKVTSFEMKKMTTFIRDWKKRCVILPDMLNVEKVEFDSVFVVCDKKYDAVKNVKISSNSKFLKKTKKLMKNIEKVETEIVKIKVSELPQIDFFAFENVEELIFEDMDKVDLPDLKKLTKMRKLTLDKVNNSIASVPVWYVVKRV
ncbi:hypothetical protein EIN_495680 [Entamoeba invadens IP1]|uniref:Uncharacterized protein n=1 Tax=Entamoeba invadens IP1 TaxID=370355 RepID=A0A0A1U5M5_ENTIV|nr:hypothetical protein EIN_495680 [Entamoeba invadens IP1]ELP87103.1 hypothetical protein EIN_495680 [Entamoeba invadens IP1]|eukprot:XP_004253874.1 hypothetical protein EIN_495680 [Entamoeba invadens IP1]